MPPAIKIGDEVFEIASEEARLSTEYIHKVWVLAGKPNRLEGESAWKVMDAIMQIWYGCYPWEVDAWREDLREEQSLERSPSDANKRDGGYFPISYPTRILQLVKVYFPNEQLADRGLVKKFVNRYPILKRTKYNI